MERPKSRRRFPELYSVGFTQEISDGIKRSLGSGLFTASDMIRLYVYRGLVADGHIAPSYQQETQHHINGNGGASVIQR